MPRNHLPLKPAVEVYWQARRASYELDYPSFFAIAWKVALRTFDLAQTTEESIQFTQEMAPLVEVHRTYFVNRLLIIFKTWDPHPLTLESLISNPRKDLVIDRVLELYQQRQQLSSNDLVQALLDHSESIIRRYLDECPRNVPLTRASPLYRLVAINVHPSQTTVLGGHL